MRATGSSPLARGTHPPPLRRERGRRFIPARAGNTTGPRRTSRTRPVHPRSRGEHRLRGRAGGSPGGSSPLARGTPGPISRARDPKDGSSPLARGTPTTTGAARFFTTVHPRSRGEHRRRRWGGTDRPGSSPLARGTPDEVVAELAGDRFIPARAGNTWRCMGRGPPAAVHPRSRGEHYYVAMSGAVRTGSSPLARGTPPREADAAGLLRFIPARAGNTAALYRVGPTCTVHPRSRGEHVGCDLSGIPAHGSSPLARGTPSGWSTARTSRRFIPARAGNTRGPETGRRKCPVHPRSRGEHLEESEITIGVNGSSPLARGTRSALAHNADHCRFIPARAGNTSTTRRRIMSTTVHPRSRGEHHSRGWSRRARTGSSPLARGTRRRDDRLGQPHRFIPARAGNTPRSRSGSPAHPVHPRSRGEHTGPERSSPSSTGSSPLARGTLVTNAPSIAACRFIPARAGNTPSPYTTA